MLLWETIKAEFAWEGSWRDICVPDVDIGGWRAAMRALEVHGHTGELHVGDATPSKLGDISTLFRADGPRASWSTEVGGVVLCCRFFDPSQVEFDLDPREVKGQAEVDGLLSFMRILAAATGKLALMTPENMHDVPFIRVLPSGVVEYLGSGGFFEERARMHR